MSIISSLKDEVFVKNEVDKHLINSIMIIKKLTPFLPMKIHYHLLT